MTQIAGDLNFFPATALGSEGQLACARLIIASFPKLYGMLPLPDKQRTSVIAKQLHLARGETGKTTAAVFGKRIVGIYAFLSSSQVKSAQLISAAALTRELPKYSRPAFQEALTVFAAQVPEVPQDTIYLSRLAVDPAYHGSGAASDLMNHLYETACGAPISAHALRTNARALAFYKKEGFEVLHNGNTEYVAVLRPD